MGKFWFSLTRNISSHSSALKVWPKRLMASLNSSREMLPSPLWSKALKSQDFQECQQLHISCCCSFLWPPSSVAKKCRDNNLNFPFRELFKQYFFPMALSSQITSDSQGVLRLLRYLANVSQLPKFFAMKRKSVRKVSFLPTFYIRVPFMYFLFTFFGAWKFKHFLKLLTRYVILPFGVKIQILHSIFTVNIFSAKIHFSIASI